MENYKISENFNFSELVISPTAIRLQIDNTPSTPRITTNLESIVIHLLQPIRDHLGEPIKITSGYRSPRLNQAIGGSNKSQHTKGEALDVVVFDGENSKIFNAVLLLELDFDQMIWEKGDNYNPDWVHLSYKHDGGNRNQILRFWGNGRYTDITNDYN